MKNLFFSLFILVFIPAKAQLPDGDPNWQLVFSDDFNTFNTNNWAKQSFSDNYSQTGEVVKLEKNVNIINGKLVINTQVEYTTCPSYIQNSLANNPGYPAPFYGCNQSFYNYTSGGINTVNSLFHFGYYEARIRMDYGSGHWPAFWLANYGSPVYSEIDIFEMVGGSNATLGFTNGYVKTTNPDNGIYTSFVMDWNHMTTNVHGYGNPNISVIDGGNEFPALNGVSDYRQWHTYGFEWSPTRMKWYVDNVMVRSIPTPIGFNADIQMNVILSSGVDKGATSIYYFSGTKNMEIDYFKYYKLNANCTPPINQVCYNFNAHTDIAKESYSLGNFCYNTVPNDKLYIFKGKDYVELKGEFNVPLGSTALFDADDYCKKLPVPLIKDCYNNFNTCNYNFSIYDNSIKNTIELGGTNCVVPINVSDNVKLNAKEYIKLSEGFSVPLNSEVEIKILSCQ